MRYLLLLFLAISPLLSLDVDLTSFHAAFEQQITDEKGKSILYRGSIWAERPDRALWHYREPVDKRIYIHRDEVIVIEPDLEQAIIRRLNEEIDFFTIVSRAQEKEPGRYETHYGDQTFEIRLRGNLLDSISYRDSFDNRVLITFSQQEQNQPINPEHFNVSIPPEYDIIR